MFGLPLRRAESSRGVGCDQLRHALGRRAVVLEHVRVPRQVDEVADPSQHGLAVEHEVLVADLQVKAKLARLLASHADLAHPPFGSPRDGHDPPGCTPFLDERDRHVSTVPNDVDEARFGQQVLHRAGVLDVARRLVAPARFGEAQSVQTVKAAQRIARVPRLECRHPRFQGIAIEVEVRPASV